MWCVLRVWRACGLGSGGADALKLATCLGGARNSVKDHGGTMNVAPYRVT